MKRITFALIDVDGRMCSAERVWLLAATVERGCVEWFRFAAVEVVCVRRATAPMRCSYNSNALVKIHEKHAQSTRSLVARDGWTLRGKIERSQFNSCQRGHKTHKIQPLSMIALAFSLFPANYFRLVFDALLNPLENVGICQDRTKPQAGYNLRDQYGNSSTGSQALSHV